MQGIVNDHEHYFLAKVAKYAHMTTLTYFCKIIWQPISGLFVQNLVGLFF